MRYLLAAVLAATVVTAPVAADDITAAKSNSTIEFKDGDKLITRYHVGESVAKPYFWPLNAPGELTVTRGWPLVQGVAGETKDHVHQKSAWFCHGDVIPEGVEVKTRSADKRVVGVDFWSEAKGHGKIVCVRVGEPKSSDGATTVATMNEWRTADGVKILDEVRVVRVSKLQNGYLIALDLDLHASVCPITFGDTKEGSMGVRVADGFRTALKDGGTITSSEGKVVPPGTKGTLSVWGQVALWNDYSGKVGGDPAGVAVFAAADNPIPSAWHTRDYGLLAANPFGRDESGYPSQKGKRELVKLKKGEHLKLRYAIYAHTGDVETGNVAAAYKKFTEAK